MADQTAIGIDSGKRTVRTEWGVRWLVDSPLTKRGQVEGAYESLYEARMIVQHSLLRAEVVCRTEVTYTTDWETVTADD